MADFEIASYEGYVFRIRQRLDKITGEPIEWFASCKKPKFIQWAFTKEQVILGARKSIRYYIKNNAANENKNG